MASLLSELVFPKSPEAGQGPEMPLGPLYPLDWGLPSRVPLPVRLAAHGCCWPSILDQQRKKRNARPGKQNGAFGTGWNYSIVFH
jgi:hypothetical protein